MVDPYYLGQKEVTTGLHDLQNMKDDRDDMLNDPRGGNPTIFDAVGVKMGELVTTLRGLLKDMAATVRQVRENRGNFNITDMELSARESFVEEAHRQVSDFENQMHTQSSNQRLQMKTTSLGSGELFDRQPGQFQETTYAPHQEEQLQRIHETVKMQRHIGEEIIHAIDEQRDMIVELDEDVNQAGAQMKKVTRQITQIIEAEGKAPTYIVAVLSLVLIVMLFWVA
jgi:hypothetical protein